MTRGEYIQTGGIQMKGGAAKHKKAVDNIERLDRFNAGHVLTPLEKAISRSTKSDLFVDESFNAYGSSEADQVSLKAIETVLEKGGIPIEYVSAEEAQRKHEEVRQRESDAQMRRTTKKASHNTAVGEQSSPLKATVISSDAGAKILQNLDNENKPLFHVANKDTLSKAAKTIKSWIDNNTQGKSFELQLPIRVQKMVREAMGRDFDSHNITSNGVRHGLKNHGIGGNKLTDLSIPITKENAELIPYIMVAPDSVTKGSTDVTGRESVRFYRDLSNGYVVVVEKEYKNSPDDLETITMWAELSKATNARKNAPDTHVRNAILSTSDVVKIIKDGETAIENDGKVQFLTKHTNNSVVYGWTENGKVYLVKERLNPETPIHEYSHIWDIALQENNPKLWKHGVELLKQTKLWDEVKNDPNYSHLKDDNHRRHRADS